MVKSSEERLDEAWRERGLAAYSTAAILGTLRHYGVDIDEERLRRVSSRGEALALAASWMARWKGTGPFAYLPPQAALELWARLGTPSTFHERFEAATLDEKLTLAREAAEYPGFDEEEAFELGLQLRESLREAGRDMELEGVLAAWEARAPKVYRAEPALLGWRVECALLRPGADVLGPLVSLAEARSSGATSLLTLTEWCLYRGHVREALAGLTAAWLRIRDNHDFSDWVVREFADRAVLTCLDAALVEAPGPTEAQLRERLALYADVAPEWLEKALALRTGQEPWRGSPEVLGQLSSEALRHEQEALVMAFEPELRARHHWPLGRTQLLLPGLTMLLPGPLRAPREGLNGGKRKLVKSSALLLPGEGTLRGWVEADSESRYHHPHAEAAVAAALPPWGDFLRRLGLIDESEHVAWRARVSRTLKSLPEYLTSADDPALADEVRRALRSGS